MSFTHGLFLFYFLPLALVVHRLALGKEAQTKYGLYPRIALFSLTLVFYGLKHPWWILPFLGCVLFDFLWASLLVKENKPTLRKFYCTCSVIQNLSLLAVFKYWNFILDSLQFIAPHLSASLPHFSSENAQSYLPAGISFYTFESLSFVIDVYRREVLPPKEKSQFFAFIAMFPRFVAGPIVRYKDMAIQFENYSGMRVEKGLLIFITGFFYKCCFADSFEKFVPYAFSESAGTSFFGAWIGVLAYSMQIYFDFAGYSLMAIGLGWCLGFQFPDNFKCPYLAESLTDFWKRWHISLSSWLRDYLYIPLGGSKKGNWRTYRNLILTMLIGGLWHGASWTYVIWGAWHGIWLALERKFQKKSTTTPVFTFLIVLLGWVFFRADNLNAALKILNTLCTPNPSSLGFNAEALRIHPLSLALCLLGLFHCFYIEPRIRLLEWAEKIELQWQTRLAAFVAFASSVLMVLSNNPIPFIYYQF